MLSDRAKLSLLGTLGGVAFVAVTGTLVFMGSREAPVPAAELMRKADCAHATGRIADERDDCLLKLARCRGEEP